MEIFKNGLNVFSVAAGKNFFHCLAEGLTTIQKTEGLEAPDITVYMPNARSIRSFQAYLMKETGGRPALLPNLKPLGKHDEDDILLAPLPETPGTLRLAPAASPMRRAFLLQKEIKARFKGRTFQTLQDHESLKLAIELSKLLDQMQNAEIDLKDLKNLVPEAYAFHWQELLEILKIITEVWPKKLKALGLSDPVERHKTLTRNLIQSWKAHPPKGPVLAAGSTGSVPVTRSLLKAIADLPKGAVIFSGLDTKMDLEAWEAVEETHPQYALKKTLEDFDLNRGKVPEWPFGVDPDKKTHTRLKFLKEALLPPAVSPRWHHLKFDQKEITRNLSVVECEGLRQEAGAIAVMMREALEEKSKTAALVTPNRKLAERVREELRRWDIEVDDSAGQPLSLTPPGAFFLLALEAATPQFSPVALLALLKHPLMTFGRGRVEILDFARTLDRRFLRGVAPTGLKALKKKVLSARSGENHRLLLSFLDDVEKALKPLKAGKSKARVSFAEILKNHIALVETLSREGKISRIWESDAGETLAGFLKNLQQEAGELGAIEGQSYATIIREFLTQQKVRRPFPNHPRLFIWGTLEARLQHPDLMILGGLNEGSWPPESVPDPWMSLEMKKNLGLPGADFRAGQSAHDFFMAAGAAEVIMTRSIKVDGTPQTPSRWLQRIAALMGGQMPRPRRGWVRWFESLDTPDEFVTLKPPAPKPPVAVRPKTLSVTNIEKLIHDPYSIYAKYILRLKPLDDLEADPGALDRGLLLHKIFEVFFKKNNYRLPEAPLEALLEIGKKEFEKADLPRPAVRAFWWPRFQTTARAFIDHQLTRTGDFEILAAEAKGQTKIGNFTITATADRIDRNLEAGTYSIIDYKSGQIPSGPDLDKGKKPQLPLEGLIAEAGGFQDLGAGGIYSLEFWDVGSPDVKLNFRSYHKNLDQTLEAARAGVKALTAYFENAKSPYLAVPDPSGHRFGDYDPLSRYREWQDQPLDGKDKS